MISQDCSHDITSTLLMTSHPLYTTWQTLYLWHHSHCNYNKTPTIFLKLYSMYITSHLVNEWQHNDCIWHDTQCICVIKPTWLMTSQTMYIWNQSHCMYDTIGTLYDITSTLADNTPLNVCHSIHSIYDIIYCVYDYPSSISDFKPVKTAISTILYVITLSLSKTSRLLCKTSQVAMYAIICVIHDIISTLYDNSPYSLWHHRHYIHYITRIVYDILSTLYDVTFTTCVTSPNDSIYVIKHYMFMTYSLVMASCTVLWPHNHCVPSQPLCLTLHSVYFWHYTQCTDFMKRSECMSSQSL